VDRREFLKDSVLVCCAFELDETLLADNPKDKIGSALQVQYIREEIPDFTIPAYRGRSYVDNVPDTLDLTERAKLGVSVLTSITDPSADYEVYWLTDIFRNPPVMLHDFNDWVQNQEGLMEVLPLLRNATGSDLNNQIDPAWMKSILKSIGPDGLLYLPLNGRPWARIKADGVNPVWRANGSRTSAQDKSVSQIANLSTCERIIGTMTLYHLRDGNQIWKAASEKMIQRLSELAIDRGDYCYFPAGSFEPNAKVDPNSPAPLGSLWGVSWNTRGVQGLAQFYSATGYEPASKLAAKLVKYTRDHGEIFDPEGRKYGTRRPLQIIRSNLVTGFLEGRTRLKVGRSVDMDKATPLDYSVCLNMRSLRRIGNCSNSAIAATNGLPIRDRSMEYRSLLAGSPSGMFRAIRLARAVRSEISSVSQ
jgi:hypothetical protein